MVRIGFIGAGNMAYAIVSGIIKSGIVPAQNVLAADIRESQLERFRQLGCTVSPAKELSAACDVIFLSVKPQNFPELLPDIADSISEDKLVVSIAAGISIAYIKQLLGKNPSVVRALPNVPMLVGCGATMLSYEPPVSGEQFGFVRSIFDSCGATAVIDERLMNESVFLHSSSPAAIFRLADTVVKHSHSKGIDSATATAMFAQTMRGCADMIEQSGRTCGELADMVTSPGGTTLAALNVLDGGDFYGCLDRAMDACKARADELGK